MLIDWNFDVSWWLLVGAGFLLGMIVSAFLFDGWNSSKDKDARILTLEEALRASDTRYLAMLEDSRNMIDKSHALSVESRQTMITMLDNYKEAWERVRTLLAKMRKRLEEHQSANIMERSLVASLDGDLASVEYGVNQHLLVGIDPEGRHTKTVKKDDDGGNSGEEINVQAAGQESQEHER